MGSFDKVILTYEHPYITILLQDNTIYTDSTASSVITRSFNGIQVGRFGAGRDNVLMYCTTADQYLEEYGDPNYKLYGQAGYNAYNALQTNYCGMYIMRIMPDNATYANTVVMARFKAIEDTSSINYNTGNANVSLAAGKNTIKELIASAANAFSFTFTSKVISGLTGISAVDSLFTHITPDWLAANVALPKFSIGTVNITVPTGVTVGDNIEIKQTSKGLKTFYSDFGMDATDVVADVDGINATKTKTYTKATLLGSATAFELSLLLQESDTVTLQVNWGTQTTTYVFNTSGLAFVATQAELTADIPKKLEVQYKAVSITDANTLAELKTGVAALYSEEKDADGYYNMPIMSFWQLGRGTYGHNTKLTFSDANEYDSTDEPTVRDYKLTVMQNTKDGLIEKEYITCRFDQDAFDSTLEWGPSLFIQDLVNDPDNGSGKIGMEFNAVAFESILNLYNANVTAANKKTVDTLDIIFGLNPDGTTDNNIVVKTTGAVGEVLLTTAEGFGFAGGSDGDFAVTNADIDTVETQLLMEAFQGNIDKRIKSRYSAPADFNLDANFPEDVKKEMVAFAKSREYDCMTYLDCNLLETSQEVINFLKRVYPVYGYNVLKEAHCYTYRDRLFTGKQIPMTITHWIAKALPTHVAVYTIGEPFARERARISNTTDFVSGTFKPVIDPDDHDIKKQIYKYGGNCFETVKYNVFQRSSCNTTCRENSDRKLEFNEYILHKGVVIAESILASKLFKIAEPAERLAYQEQAEKEIKYQLAGLVRTCSVEFKMSSMDERRNIMRLALRMTFKTVPTRGIVEVYLDPRVTDSTTTS